MMSSLKLIMLGLLWALSFNFIFDKKGHVAMIIVFGSINIDMVMPVEEFPMPGETILSADYITHTGGKGANQAVAAARQDVKVAMVGKVGDDAFGRRSRHTLKMQSILAAGVAISERPTGCAMICVNSRGENTVVVSSSANLDTTSDQLPNEILNENNTVLLDMEVEPEQIWDVVERASERGTRVILNAAPAGVIPENILKKLDYLILNEIEATQLADLYKIKEQGVENLAKAFSKKGQLTCIITIGQKGSFAVTEDGACWTSGALDVDPVDTTGAGDAFCGIFAASLEKGLDFKTALHYASVGGSLSCLGMGAQEGVPYSDALKEKLEDLDQPVQLS